MTSAVLYRKGAKESFNSFNLSLVLKGARLVPTKYSFNAASTTYQAMGQGQIVSTGRSAELISQARKLRHRHFWCFWGLRAPDKHVIDSAISVIHYCPSEFLLDGYHVENYGNGTVVMTKRSPNYMISINIGRSALSYAKLNIKDHKVVSSGKCEIESNSVAKLFQSL